MKVGKLFFVDTETTDVDPAKGHACEIAATVATIGHDGLLIVEAEYHALIRPYLLLSDFSARNFAAETWETAVPEIVAIGRLLDVWRSFPGAALIAQNPLFDLSFLRPAAARHSLAWPVYPEVDYHVFDLASMMLPIVLAGECEGVSLRHSRQWAGLSGPQAHRASGDVSDMIAVWNAIQQREELRAKYARRHVS